MAMLFLFESTRVVIKAEEALRDSKIPCKVVPVPRDVSSECGMALDVDSDRCENAIQVLSAMNIRAIPAERNV